MSQEQDAKHQLQMIPGIAVQVITKPGNFFRTMPKSGGLMPPFIFMVVLGMVAGLVQTVFSLVGLSSAGGMLTGIAAVILMPVMAAIFGFIGAAVLFLIWKIMGSGESFETAYRCSAYMAAIVPITIALQSIPYLGGIVGIVWATFLLVVASTKVHGIKAGVAWAVFGIFCVFFAITSLGTEMMARRINGNLAQLQKESKIDQLDNLDKMSAEKTGQAVGNFLKGLSAATKK